MKLLIDADYIVYKCCAAAEDEIDWGDDVIMVTSKFTDAMKAVEREITKIVKEFFEPEVILFFSSSNNFRKKISPDYKGHRNRKKPCGYKRVITELGKRYRTVLIDDLEADDALGIYATKHPDCVIVSPDKDLKQIPGTLYDFNQIYNITPEEGWQWFLVQALSGDCTDGYSGAPGFGIRTSRNIFDEEGYTWETLVKAYKSKGLTEEDALLNKRLARILQKDDYDFRKKQPIPWTPPVAKKRTNTRTRVQAKGN